MAIEPNAGQLPTVAYEFTCDEGPTGDFRIHGFHLVDEINRPYQLTIDLVTEEIDADTDLFLSATAGVDLVRGEFISSVYGVVTEVDYLGRSERELFVRLRIVPAFTLLKQITNSRIFQDMSVQDVIDEVLGGGFSDFSRSHTWDATRGTEPRDYCVQYRETDFDFVSRLLEEEGISYHFNQDVDTSAEIIVFTDENGQFPEYAGMDGTAVIPIIATRPETADIESLQTFEYRQRTTSTAVIRHDYDFLTPMDPLVDEEEGADSKGYVRRLRFHNQRRFVSDDLATRKIDHLEAAKLPGKVVHGRSNAISFFAGNVFELERHTRDDLETQWVITRIVHTGSAPDQLLEGGEAGVPYENRFECVMLDSPVRPLQRTPKPRAAGPQTAIVAGPTGEEIHTDGDGRIMVQFHWEETPAHDDTSSCWIRVAQSWAGPGWGTQFIPRIGMEVVVQFLEGNPDRPLVTGCVYNGDNTPPFALPDNKTQSGWRSNSSIGEGYNMIRLEDAAGSEEFYIHAQKDKNIKVLNCRTTSIDVDDTLDIGRDRTKDVGRDQAETVVKNKSITVGGDHSESIGGTETRTTTKDISITGAANRSETLAINQTTTIGGANNETVGKTKKTTVALKCDEIVGAMKSVKVGGVYSEQVGASRSITAVGAFSVTAGLTGKLQCAKSITIKAQKDVIIAADKDLKIDVAKKADITIKEDITLKGEKKTAIEVTDEITIKCGSGQVIVKKNGDITIKGKKINIKGSGDVVIKGSKVSLN